MAVVEMTAADGMQVCSAWVVVDVDELVVVEEVVEVVAD